MSLINCSECGKEISDKADKCPNCGCPITKKIEVVQEVQTNFSKTENKKTKYGTAKLVIGIVSMFLFIIIAFQSCSVGLSNAISGSDESSGSFGIIVGILITIAGIISVSTNKSVKKGGSIWCVILYYICALFSFVGAGRYADLKLWGFLGFCFGFFHLISILSTKKSKIIGSVCSVLFIIFIISGSGTTENETENDGTKANSTEISSEVSQSKSEVEEESESIDNSDETINFVTDKISIVYTGFEMAKDYEGNDCIVLYFDFTNNGKDNTNAAMSTYIQVFQDGVECESAMLSFDYDIDATENYLKDIQSGNTINVAEVFEIKSDSDITIEASEAFSFSDKLDSMVLKIN